MIQSTVFRAALALSIAGGLSACMQAPTYGTGKRSDVQLLEDIANMASIAPQTKEQIDYKPRPDLVEPANEAALPAPQDDVTKASAAWPESPEQRRARLRAEATANKDNPFYVSPIVNTGLGQVNTNGDLSPEEQAKRFRAGLAVKNGAYSGRRYLSDPPAELKVPSETAPVGDLGEPESKKERRRLAEARKAGGGFSLRDLWPF